MIQAKSLTSEELGQIEDEWEDSTVVRKLLGHVMYLTDTIIRLTGQQEAHKGEDRGG